MTCPCPQAIALLDSAERIFRRVGRCGDVLPGVAASWLVEREKLTCPCAAARSPAGEDRDDVRPCGERP